jgi:hypothetical protein
MPERQTRPAAPIPGDCQAPMKALAPVTGVTGDGGSDHDGPLRRLWAMTPVRAHAAPRGTDSMPWLIHSTKRGLHVSAVPRSDSFPSTLDCERQYRPPPERRDSRMSVAVERRTVSLWPSNASPVSSGPQRPRKAAVVQRTDETEDPATRALAAITSSYRHIRAGIISGHSSPTAGHLGGKSPADLALPTHAPTVPLTLLSHEPAEVPQPLPPGQGREVATFWSRLVRTRRPTPRGRHSPKC